MALDPDLEAWLDRRANAVMKAGLIGGVETMEAVSGATTADEDDEE